MHLKEHTIAHGTHSEAASTTVSLVQGNEEWLMEQILAYAKAQGYTPYTSTLICAWRVSITGLSDSIVQACRLSSDLIEFTADDDFEHSPIADFARLEAQAHRQRGISLGMFMGLLKYYRETYIDLVETRLDDAGSDPLLKHDCARIITRCFDLFEIALCSEWNATDLDTIIEELRDTARTTTNEKNFYLTAFESLLEPAFLLDKKQQILSLNDAAVHMVSGKDVSSGELYYRRQVEAVQGRSFAVNGENHPETSPDDYTGLPVCELLPELQGFFEAAGQQESPVHEEVSVERRGGTLEFIATRSPMLDVSGKFLGSVLFLTNITDRKHMEAELRELATRDALTGVHNRRAYENLISVEVHRAKRTLQPLCCVSIDIDHFKIINDRYGHALGDKALVRVAEICESETRRYDSFARLGGEEFMMLLPQTTLAEAVELAERLRNKISVDCRRIDDEEIALTVSLGVAELDLVGGDVSSLEEHADSALYAAKDAGRNTVALIRDGAVHTYTDSGRVKDWVELRRTDSVATDLVADIVRLTRAVSGLHGHAFFKAVVRSIQEASKSDFVFLASVDREGYNAQTLAMMVDGEFSENMTYDLAGTPCSVVTEGGACVYPEHVDELFPEDTMLKDMGIEAYAGVPLFDSQREFEGLLVTMSRSPLRDQERLLTLMDVASASVASELERAASERRISELVDTDHLTGYASKSALNRRLQQPGMKSVLVASLETLPIINQAYGFGEGDSVITRAAAMLRESVAASFYGALGPTKFVLVFDKDTDLTAVCDTIRQHFADNAVNTETLSVFVNFAFGAAQGEHEALRLATKELQNAKAAGVSRLVHVAKDSDHQDTSREQALIAASTTVHEAIASGSVSPRFQRIVSLEDGHTHKVEALARIISGDEVLAPAEFLQAVKASGNMPALTRQMIDKTFAIMKAYKVPFSINISEFDLEEGQILAYLEKISAEHGIAPERVTLELLETISSSAKTAHIQQLRDFKNAGFKLAIDDFGAEYSSFARILELDVDYLKIDARFATRVHEDARCAEIIRAIVYFCQNAGIHSIAEHVDSDAIAASLREIGVDYAQGFLFARPEEVPV